MGLYNKYQTRRGLRRRRLMSVRRRPMLYAGGLGSNSGRPNKKMKFSPKAVGFHKKDASCVKSHLVMQSSQPWVTRSLLSGGQSDINVTQIPDVTDHQNDMNRRNLDHLFYRGFTYHMQIRNNSALAPLTVNVAVVSPKAGVSVVSNEFFRSPDSGERGVSFSTALSNIEMHSNAINTDLYTVIRHKRYTIGIAQTGTAYTPVNRNWLNIKKHIKIHRQLRYSQAGVCTTPIFLLCWMDQLMSPGGTVGTAGNAASFQLQVIAHFSEPTC